GGPAAPPQLPGAAPSGPQQPPAWTGPSGAQPPLHHAQPPPEQPLQGRVVPPGGAVPGMEDATQVVPPVAEDATQVVPPVAEDATQVVPPVAEDATQVVPPVDAAATRMMPPVDGSPSQAPRDDDMFGGLPMFRDEVPARDTTASTAEMDLSEYDAYASGRGRRRAPSGALPVSSRTLLVGAGFLALLLVAGGTTFLLASRGGSTAENTEPAQYDVSLVADESTDPEPLKAGELFAEETVEVDGETFTLLLTDDTDKCATTAHGDYGDVLTEHQCRQVVRATYVNEEGTRAVTVGVVAMADSEGAQAAAEAQDPAGTQWFAGLAGQEGSGAERMDIAGGHVSSAVWGRYVVFSLAANSDGRTPQGENPELAGLSEYFVDVALAPLGERAVS
ncbi:hypothetical protein, partial [Thermobifida cellulosilytica]|uniref:hypothetical protein n=1 Tax=Thermobifida cellulosilytica TaxID=144786 RepID=UPI001E34297C